MWSPDLRLGTVASFDEGAGLGVITSDGHEWPFHCVSILDGTRRIDVGVAVAFTVRFCTLRREAIQVTRVRT